MNRTPESPHTDDVDLGALWRAVAEKKALLAGLVLSAALATFIALQFVTPLYTSQARILIENDETSYLRPRDEQGKSDIRVLMDPEAVASQVQVLLSRDLAHGVVKDLKLEDNPEFITPSGPAAALKRFFVAIGLSDAPTASTREEYALDAFERHLSVYPVAKSRVIAVEFDSRDAKMAAAVANRLAETYIVWQQKTQLSQTRDASQWLSEQIKTLRERVAESEAAVERFRSSSGLIAGSNDITLDAQQLSELNSQLILARAQRSEAEARASLIRRMLKEKGDVAAAPDVLRSTLIQRLLEQRVRLRRELAELSATLLSSHPRIRQLNSELADLKRQIHQEAQKVVSSLENEAQIAGAREASLRASLDELKTQSASSRGEQVKLRSLEREAKANRDLLESYLARYGDASARDESSVPSHASIIARAHVEREPSFPKKGPISALVGAAAGLLALASIIGRELMTGPATGRASRPAPMPAAPRRAGQPAQQPAPAVHRRAASRRPVRSRARSSRAAARALRGKCTGPVAHNLFVTAATHRANSALDTVDVARKLAANGSRVGIVDFSTADSGVADIVGVSGVPGLGELLTGAAGFEDVIGADKQSPVQIIPPGTLQMETFAGEGAAQWRRVHQALRQIYDCVILHTSVSGAVRLAAGMQGEPATLLLVTGKKPDDALAEQIAGQISRGLGAGIDVITYDGAPPPKQPPHKQKTAGAMFGRPAAAAV